MTREVDAVDPDTSTMHSAELLAERGFAALPVIDDGGLVGIVAEAAMSSATGYRSILGCTPAATSFPHLLEGAEESGASLGSGGHLHGFAAGDRHRRGLESVPQAVQSRAFLRVRSAG